MAKETKIGLLAGLAFIICFAVILANRGRRPPINQAGISSVLDGPIIPGIRIPVNFGLRPQGGTRLDPAHRQAVSRPATSSRVSNNRTDRAPTTGGEIHLGGPLGNEVQPATTREPSHTQRSLASRSSTTQAPPDPREATTDNAPGSHTTVTSPSHPNAHEAQPRGMTSGKPGVRYTVVPGDTLSKIIAAHYSRSSPAIIRAIVRANAGSLADPDRIYPGMDLILPKVARPQTASQTTKSPARLPTGSTPGAVPAGTNPSKDLFRWYQIKTGDRYVGIAREQLGDARRWHEIFELNKDKFSNPHVIREGVRIKLPAPEPGRTAERRR